MDRLDYDLCHIDEIFYQIKRNSLGFICIDVVVLRLTVEWGVGMERQDPSYGGVVNTRDLQVQALLRGSNGPTSRSPEAVDWIICMCVCYKGCEPLSQRRGWLI